MSLVDAPMALIDRILGRRDVPPDDPLVRHLSESMSRWHPDALFERRLRGEIVNRYVVAGETRARRLRARHREMGTLGRAVLYASVGLALSATVVGAAAQQAAPGDPLYAVKVRLEEIRIEIAPAALRPQLVALALDERLGELERLAGRGDWKATAHASALVDQAAAELAAFGPGRTAQGAAAVQRHADALNGLISDAPESARAGLEHALVASGAATGVDVSPADAHAHGGAGGDTTGDQHGRAGPPQPSPPAPPPKP